MQYHNLKGFYHSAWFVNKYILITASHNQLHLDIVNLLSSSPGTTVH